jgi:hypothetical protein
MAVIVDPLILHAHHRRYEGREIDRLKVDAIEHGCPVLQGTQSHIVRMEKSRENIAVTKILSAFPANPFSFPRGGRLC